MFPEGRALEFLLAAVIALIVVGPKDLPVLLRKFGQFMGKLRSMANEFRASFDEMARQSELDELRKEVEAMRRGQFADAAHSATAADVHQTFDDIHQGLSDVGMQLHPPMSHQYYEAPSEPLPAAPAPKPRIRKTPAKPAATAKAPAKRAPTEVAGTKAAGASTAPKPAAKPRTRKPAEPKA
jgi:sec-independent protein translocase protein TatB